MTGDLTKAEAASLAKCEQIIERGLATFYDVGRALLTIGEQKLYRASYDSFEAYCSHRWGFDRTYGYRLIGSAKVIDVLKASPIGDKALPLCEAQARPLVNLTAAEIPDVWREVLDRAGSQRVTATLVDEVVKWWKTPGDERREASASVVLDGDTVPYGQGRGRPA